MKTDMVTIDEYAPVDEARDLMIANNIGCLPVVNKKELIGLVTVNDL